MKAIRAAFSAPGVNRCALGTAADASQHAELQRRIGVEPIRVPCLYLHGEMDGCIGYAVASGMAELFPYDLDRRVLPGVGHFLHLERPDDVNGIIAEYLAGAA
jgi:pimeloyl-ACP methyl ester carboxylesterase